MTHDEIIALLAAFADGELENRQRQLIEQHVRGCAECAGRLEEFRRLSRVLRRWSVPSASAEKALAFSHSLVQMLPPMPAASHLRRPAWASWAFPAGLVAWGALVEAAAILTLAFGLTVMLADMFAPASAWLSWLTGLLPSLNVPGWWEAVQGFGRIGCQVLGTTGLLPAAFWEWLISFLWPTAVYVSLLSLVSLGVWGWFGVQMARRRL